MARARKKKVSSKTATLVQGSIENEKKPYIGQKVVHSGKRGSPSHNRRPSFSKSSGILAALPEQNHYQLLYRKVVIPSSSSTVKVGATIPRPTQQENEYSKKFQQQQSAPVNVPLLSIAVARERNKKFLEVDYFDEDGEQEMLPPHEIVARGFGLLPKTTFSVHEGVGRTLKGRDLRQVRNAIFRKTGFLD